MAKEVTKKAAPDAAAPVKAKASPKPRAPRKAKADAPEPEVEIDAATEEEVKATRASGKSLVIVESPAKAKTINKYLGKSFVVRASMGHIRDLPKGKFGIDMEHGFEPQYTAIRGKAKVIAELKRIAGAAKAVYLAPDMDREGEAIAWHLREALELDESKTFRVVFNEITKNAILEAFEKPGKLDMDKVDAQQARRVLDRIMGYKLSPLLWKKVAKGLSAGRVQSVAVRLIVEREREIRAFVKEEYWRVTAYFTIDGQTFQAELKRIGETRIDKNLDQKTAQELVQKIGGSPLALSELEDKPKSRPPTPPFTTSQLQQKAATMLRYSAKKTMMVAQRLYEGVEIPGEGSVGLITYMRTDSTRVSDDALKDVRSLIGSEFGAAYLPDKPNVFRTKSKGAQEAHEAIRPTDVKRTPAALQGALTEEQYKLYKLIWDKFVSSQMKPGLATITTAAFTFGDARFVAQGEVEVFDGCTRVFGAAAVRPPTAKEGEEGGEHGHQALPKSLKVGEQYTPKKIDPTQHWTQPPPRYSEATLVKELEKKGIGRPSTYAAIISTIQDRGYVLSEQRKFSATELGEIVIDLLVAHFGDVINTDFTASMELKLDEVEGGRRIWRDVVKNFNDVFMSDLGKAEDAMKNWKREPTLSDKLCDKCGAPMAVLFNKRGKFLGCSKYPECKNTMGVDGPRPAREVVETDKVCQKCGKPMVIRTGSRGRFIACTGYPKCKNTASVDDKGEVIKPKETGIACDKCSSPMVVKSSRRGPFLACSAYPKCRNAKPLPDELREAPKETGIVCDKCGKPMVEKMSRWGKPFIACTGYPECKNTKKTGE
ncbi:MAG: type I DNA topoisomerase, partial [Planctomycetes bacterium]|nr:type I DNA topoisomerase [Planctomycetota bacterium]